MSSVAQVALAGAAAVLGYTDWWWECSAGFSGVLFALKVVCTHEQPGSTHVMGFSVPTRWAAWAELLTLYFFLPASSFVSHLAGIIAGLAWLAMQRQGALAAVRRGLKRALAALSRALGDPPAARRDGHQEGEPQQQRQAPQPRFYGGGVPLGGGTGMGGLPGQGGLPGLRYRGGGTPH